MVYVDDAEVSKYGRDWFHLTADSVDELHAFAVRIGLPSRAFHRGARYLHYDVTAAQRLRALSNGAVAVSSRQLVRVAPRVCLRKLKVAAPLHGSQLVLFA